MEFVLDASIAMRWLRVDPNDTPDTIAYADSIARLTTQGETIHVPAMFWLEVANVTSQSMRAGEVGQSTVDKFRDLLWALNIQTHHEDEIVWLRSFWLANEYGLTVYDASYLELATTGMPLATLDKKLYKVMLQVGCPAPETDTLLPAVLANISLP